MIVYKFAVDSITVQTSIISDGNPLSFTTLTGTGHVLHARPMQENSMT